MQTNNKVIVLELNEVPWKVIDTFVERNPASTFARVMGKSGRINTLLPDVGQLHPKTSWQTFHRGVPDHTHGIREYNQLQSAGHANNPTMWELAQRAGKRVGCGASIGSWPLPKDTSNVDFWFADPFAPDPESIPSEVTAFQRFNTLAVARSSRQVRSGGVSRKVITDFLKSAPSIGITSGTALKTVHQVVSEKFKRPLSVRRRNIQALMSFDVALKQWKTTQPHLSSIFINHVAAAMHRYWAAAFPDDYQTNKMPADWRETYKEEINAAMLIADGMLERVLKEVEGTGTSVLVLGSMGQAGIEHEPTFNQLIINDMPAFMRLAGMNAEDYEQRPGMEPEYLLVFKTKELLDRLIKDSQNININGQAPDVKRASDTECSLLVDQYNVDFESVSVGGRTVNLKLAGLHIERIEDIAGSTAQHTPEGAALLIHPERDLSHLSANTQFVDVCAVTSAILEALDVPVPSYMPKPPNDLVLAMQSEKHIKSEKYTKPGPNTVKVAKTPVLEDAATEPSVHS